MAITPYGAVLENNNPSPIEIFSYFDQKRQQQGIANDKLRLEQQKLEEKRREGYDKTLSKLNDYKGITGNVDINKVTDEQLAALRAGAKDHNTQPGELEQYISQGIRNIDGFQKWWGEVDKSIEAQAKDASKYGLDETQMKELMKHRVLFKDDGKGGKTLISPEDISKINPANLSTDVINSNPDLLSVNNREKLYAANPGADPYTMKDKAGNTQSLKYDLQFQRPATINGKLQAVTNSAPIYSNDGERAKDPLTGKPATGLDPEAFKAFESNPARLRDLNQLTNEKVKQLEAKRIEDKKQLAERMNAKNLKGMSMAERLGFYHDINTKGAEVTDDEKDVLRKQAAFELVDNNMVKHPADVREKTIINVRTSSGADKKETPEALFTKLQSDPVENGTKDLGKYLGEWFVKSKDEDKKVEARNIRFDPIRGAVVYDEIHKEKKEEAGKTVEVETPVKREMGYDDFFDKSVMVNPNSKIQRLGKSTPKALQVDKKVNKTFVFPGGKTKF